MSMSRGLVSTNRKNGKRVFSEKGGANRNGPPQARLTRRGLKLTRWPLEHLAIVRAIGESYPSFTWEKKLWFLRENRPDICEKYLQRNSRPLTRCVLHNRYDKSWRQREMERFSAFMENAFIEVRKWRT